MKQKYEKPVLFSESFELEETICSACSTKATLAEDTCPVDIPMLGSVFTLDISCTIEADIDICYHVAKPGENVFSSAF